MVEPIFEELESNARGYCRMYPCTFNRAEGPYIWDTSGKKYIDFLLGAGSLNYGHNQGQIVDSMIEYLRSRSVLHGLDLHTEAKKSFLEAFKEIILVPRNMDYKVMFTGPTGTNAVEAAIKMARLATKRERIAAFTNAYHGMTLGALALTGNRFNRDGAGTQLHSVDRYPYDGYFGKDINTIEMIEKLISDPSSGYEPPAAFIIESVQAEGGLNVASKAWLEALSSLANKVGALVIYDEIQVGCGRTGRFFSFEGTGVIPDIICLSKSISGSGLPMSILLTNPKYDVFLPGQHNGTFRGNNLAFVSAKVALDFWSDRVFLNNLLMVEKTLHEDLASMATKHKKYKIKGCGLIQGLECPNADVAEAIQKTAFNLGLLIETCGKFGEVIKLMPPLNISKEILKEAIRKLDAAMWKVESMQINVAKDFAQAT